MIESLLGTSYIYYAGTIYQQIRGISQGASCSPQLADLTLSIMEFDYIKSRHNNFREELKMFEGTFRYIDDILHISNNVRTFENNLKEIYHPSLNIEKTNVSTETTNFLDLNITIKNGTIVYKLYNKTDDYNFRINKYPKYYSNIPIHIIKNTFIAEVIRIHRTCSEYISFKTRIIELCEVSSHNGWDKFEII